MRKPFVAGNWKMNMNLVDSIELAKGVAAGVSENAKAEVAICPPHVYLSTVIDNVDGTHVGVGAQNCYHEKSGAFTGETSAGMLSNIGCKYVILGHSERRHVMGETDADINKKVLAALDADLIPIVCVGELLQERESGKTTEVVHTQVDGSLAGLTNQQAMKIVIAYEPVWAIGTGKVATPEQAEEVHLGLRNLMENRYNSDVSQALRIQYGGSVKPGNAAELLSQPNIDGALVGGASLKVDDFLAIIEAA